MNSSSSDSKVCVLLATYNGEAFLQKQLQSFVESTVQPRALIVCDDGSTDQTLDILQTFASAAPFEVKILQNEANIGSTKTFLKLLFEHGHDFEYIMFSDQDDVWHQDKIAKALEWFRTVPYDVPALYGCRQRLIDAKGNAIALSPSNTKPAIFANAVVQSIIAGCTSCINKPAFRQLQKFERFDVIYHDWLIYLGISAVDGNIFFDNEPHIDYRQHSAAQLGAATGFMQDIRRRFWQHFSGETPRVMRQNIAFLQYNSDLLNNKNKMILKDLDILLNGRFMQRIACLQTTSIYRQSSKDSFILKILVLLGIKL